jgi:hypothetical protein
MRILRASLNWPKINDTKFVSTLVTLVLTALLIFGIPFQMPTAKADIWRGTAPFCQGKCLPGEKVVKKSNCGNGGCCWSGSKVLCRTVNSAFPASPSDTERITASPTASPKILEEQVKKL